MAKTDEQKDLPAANAEQLTDDQLDQAQGGLCMNEVIKDIVSPRDPASGLPTGNFIGTTVEGTNI